MHVGILESRGLVVESLAMTATGPHQRDGRILLHVNGKTLPATDGPQEGVDPFLKTLLLVRKQKAEEKDGFDHGSRVLSTSPSFPPAC